MTLSIFTIQSPTGAMGSAAAAAGHASKGRLVAIGLFAIVLLGAVLRLWQLDAAPIWWDEGNNAYFAHHSLSEIVAYSRLTNDTDPPAHRVALGLWLWIFGDSAFAVRAFSALLGVALVALVYHWGQSLAGAAAGLVAAILTALSPMAIYYSREAKGYPMVALFGLLSFYLWSHYLESRRTTPLFWVAYVLCAALALLTHYYAIFLFVAQALWLVLDWLQDRHNAGQLCRRALSLLAANATVAVLVLPWVLLTYDTALSGARGVGDERAPYSLTGYLSAVVGELAAGPDVTLGLGAAVAIVLAAAAVYGGCRTQFRHWGPLATLVLTAVGLSFIVQRELTFFSPRFVLYVAPCLFLMAALGIVRLKKVGGLAVCCVVALWLAALPQAYVSRAGAEEDLRPIAKVLRETARPDDVVIVSYIWQEGMLRLYAPGERLYRLGWFDRENDAAKVEAEMSRILGGRPRLWLLTYKAPLRHQVSPGGYWLEQNAARMLISEHGNNRAVLYANPLANASAPLRAVAFEDGIHLAVGDIAGRTTAGEALVIDMAWWVDAPTRHAYSVFVHLNRARGEKPVAQSDDPPAHGLKPFTQFVPGEKVPDRRALLIPSDLPPGSYSVNVGVYRPTDGARLKRVDQDGTGSDSVLLGYVEVVP